MFCCLQVGPRGTHLLVIIYFYFYLFIYLCFAACAFTYLLNDARPGIEPATSRSQVRRSTDCTTETAHWCNSLGYI